VVLCACGRQPEDFTPDEVLKSFLAAIERSTNDPEARKTAYAWVDDQSKAALIERAELTASLAGQKLAPWELLVPGRVSFAGIGRAELRMRVRVDGDKASVEIPIENRDSVSVPMLREEGVWHVVLGLSPTRESE
jgi:hypothetical protein